MNKNNQFTADELLRKITEYFTINKPEDAEKLYQRNLNIVPGVAYYRLLQGYKRKKETLEQKQSRLKQKRQQREQEVKQKICRLLREYDFTSADTYYSRNKQYYPEAAYISLRNKYEKDQLISDLHDILPLKLENSDRALIAQSIIQKEESLPDQKLSQEDALLFISRYLDIKKISLEGASNLICLLAARPANSENHIQGDILIAKVLDFINIPCDRIAEIQGLSYKNLPDSNKITAIWKILSNDPATLKKIAVDFQNSLNRISMHFPWDKLDEISAFYIPPEEEFIKLIINNPSLSQTSNFKNIIKKQGYFNCKTICILLWLKKEYALLNPRPSKEFLLKNIIEYLTRLIIEDFDYNRANNTKTKNLIFPSCVSHSSNRAISLSTVPRKFIFCEGNWVDKGSGYIMCRNHRCDEKGLSLKKQTTTYNTYFVDFLEDSFGITVGMLYRSKDFMKCMGALTRGNELTDALCCGYHDNNGCGSALTYSHHFGRDGFIAYTTSYWQCSNPSCSKQNQPIKISHCAGCNKIIDSRIDNQKCPGNYENPIYICKSCGYCCKAHIVSGICPDCGTSPTWTPDKYSSRYTCSNCSHTIKIPVIHKEQAQAQLNPSIGAFKKGQVYI